MEEKGSGSIFEQKVEVRSCGNSRVMKLMSHTRKLWERVVDARLRSEMNIWEQQFGFAPRKKTTDVIFALRMLLEKNRSAGAVLSL